MGRKLTRTGAERKLRHAFGYLRGWYRWSMEGPEFEALVGALHEIRCAHEKVKWKKKRPLKF